MSMSCMLINTRHSFTGSLLDCVVRADLSFLPNMGGTNQQRVVSEISDTEMKFTNPRTATGAVLNITWKKAQ